MAMMIRISIFIGVSKVASTEYALGFAKEIT